MIEFMSKKKSLVIYTMFLIVLIYGLKIANTSYGMDTNWFIQNPSGYMNYWISIGRFGEVILKKIFLKEFTNIYMINTLTCILLGITSLYITYLFSDYIEIRENKKLFIVPSLFITSQLFVFQYYFVLQNFEFSLAMLLTVIVASYCLKVRTFSGLKKIIIYIILISLMTLVIGVYQTFILFFIQIIVAMLLLEYKKSQFSFSELIVKAFPSVLVLLLGIACYWLLDKLIVFALKTTHANHSLGMITWFDKSFVDGLSSLRVAFTSMFPTLGETPNIYGFSFIVAILFVFLILIIYFYKRYDVKICSLLLFLLFLAGLGIVIASGTLPTPRSMVPQYPFLIAFIAFYLSILVDNDKLITNVILGIVLLLTFTQVKMSSNLVVAEDAIFREDQQKIQLIYQAVENLQLENKSDYKLMIIGSSPAKNKQRFGNFGDLVGVSMFEFGGTYAISTNVVSIMENMGMSYQSPTYEEYMNYWKNRTTLEHKNTDFGIEVIDNMIIVKVTPNL